MLTHAVRSGRKSAVVAVGAALTSVVLAACGSGSSKPVAAGRSAGGSLAGQTITVYSGQHEQTMDALVKGFTAHTGVKVQLRSGDEAELAQQLLVEGAASPADVFVSENPPTLTTLEEKGSLAKVDASTRSSAVPAADSSAGGDWLGVSARRRCSLQHRRFRPPSPDVGAPPWRARRGRASSASRRARPTSPRSSRA